MAAGTKRYKILFVVVSKAASGLNVVDLKILKAATMSAAPPVAVQNCLPQALV